MSTGYLYSDDPPGMGYGGGSAAGTSPTSQCSTYVSPAPKLSSSGTRSRHSGTSSARENGFPPSSDTPQQCSKPESGGTNGHACSNGSGRRPSAAFEPISFNTGGGGGVPDVGGGQTSSAASGGLSYCPSGISSPAYAEYDPQKAAAQDAPRQQQQLFLPASQQYQPPPVAPPSPEFCPPGSQSTPLSTEPPPTPSPFNQQHSEGGNASSLGGTPPAGFPPKSARETGTITTARTGSANDSFSLSVNQCAPFSPPSSGRGRDVYYRQPSGRCPSQPQPQLSLLPREGSGSVHAMMSPSLSPQIVTSARSGHEAISPRLERPAFAEPAGARPGVPHQALFPRGPASYQKTGSISSVGGHSDDLQHRNSPSAANKSFTETGGGGGGGGAVRRDDGSSMEGSSRRGSFRTSPSVQGRSGRLSDETTRNLPSRLSSPAISYGFGSPTSTTGGFARTPHHLGDSGATTPRLSSFQRVRVVGSGGFGKVYQAILSDGTLAAVKELKRETTNLKAIDREVRTMSNLPPHQNCVRYFGSCSSKNHYYIVMEYISGGSINSLRQSIGPFRESVFNRYAFMVLLGLEHLHSNGIIHRDIKGANVLVDERGCAKIVDFGCCKDLNQGTQTLGTGGTPLWMAPEICRGDPASVKSDVWSFGCLCLEMTNETGLPWSFPNTMTLAGVVYALASATNPPAIPTTLSKVAQDFIACCLRLNPEERLDVPDLLKHPFFDLTYQCESDSDDEGVVSRDTSARESEVKRMTINPGDDGEGGRINSVDVAQPRLTPWEGGGSSTPKITKRNPNAPQASSRTGSTNTASNAISFNTAGTPAAFNTRSASDGATTTALQSTVHMGFQLDAVDEESSDSMDSMTNIVTPGCEVGLRPGWGHGAGAAEGASFAEDDAAAVNDIISRARHDGSPLGARQLSSTVTGSHAMTGATVGTDSSPHRRHTRRNPSDFSSSSSSTYTSRSSSSSAIPSPHQPSRSTQQRNSAAERPPPSMSATRTPATHYVFSPRGDSPDPEALSPREPEGGTKPKASRGEISSVASSNLSRGSATSVPKATFRRRTTFPLSHGNNVSPSSANTIPVDGRSAGGSSPKPKSSSTSTKPLAPGGPSGAKPTEPSGPSYPTSDGVSKSRSSANKPQTQDARVAPSSPSTINGTSAPSPSPRPVAPFQPLVRDEGSTSEEMAFTFSSGSQGHVVPAKKSRPSTANNSGTRGTSMVLTRKSTASSSTGLDNTKVWESGGRDSISKEFTSGPREVMSILSHIHPEDRSRSEKKETAAEKAEKRRSGPARWFWH